MRGIVLMVNKGSGRILVVADQKFVVVEVVDTAEPDEGNAIWGDLTSEGFTTLRLVRAGRDEPFNGCVRAIFNSEPAARRMLLG
jgi:hypothetical protein